MLMLKKFEEISLENVWINHDECYMCYTCPYARTIIRKYKIVSLESTLEINLIDIVPATFPA